MKRTIVAVGILILFFLPLVSNQVKTVNGNASMSLHQSGYQLLDANNNVVYLHGCCDFDTDYDTGAMGGGDKSYMLARFQWIQSQGGNFYRIFINGEWLVGNTGNYRGHLEDLLNAAESYNIYVVVMFSELKQGAGGFEVELPYDPYIRDPGWTTSSFNNACAVLANLLKNHPNALLEIWNEPMNMDQSAYYNTYWNNVPTTIQQIRNAGFGGIICVMGEASFAPGYDGSGMVWAISHPTIFGPGKNVMAEFHAYYQYLHADGHYPDDKTQLSNLWLNTGRILEAQQDGIPIFMGENGVNINKFSTYSEAKQDQALQNGLDICIANGIHYTVQDFTDDKSADEILLSSKSPYTWNNAGIITHNAWIQTPIATSNPYRADDPLLGPLSITTTVTHTLVITKTTWGTTSPAAGSYSYNDGASVKVTANAARGYRFDHWMLDGTNVGSANPTTVTMNTDHTLAAVFSKVRRT